MKLRKKLTNATAAQQKAPREPITQLFTFDGQLVTSLVDIPPDCCYLLAQTNGNFRPPNIEALIPKDAEAEAGQFAENIIKASKIKMDRSQEPANSITKSFNLV